MNKFTWKDAEKLKLECARALRKAGHTPPPSGLRQRKRRSFSKPDESKIREIKSSMTFWNWVDAHGGKEPIEANPDFWEQEEDDAC